ncbi:hypothetical protein [Fulvivirga sedimenti]|jgi:uncharacterized protein (DUF342 family)|uniref:Transcription elongation factor GreA/GreB C-terminal domain-containing protein n=1 Tax=Fulvivirga sedimenti TaxID=2879465 RepID=A0A9X1HUR4_9BACT|nr:hypothetical protein [Fulvivirga sedimenti]MCA6078684.1 hypothetical protein [Fulvivirga sedimenti]
MNKIEFKREALQQARISHQKVLEDLKYGIEELQKSEMGLHEDQLDMDQQSLDDVSNETIIRLGEQLNFARDEMELLNRMVVQEPLHSEVTLGSIVETDQRTFYVSASIEKYTVNDREIFGLSTHTPVYSAMKGMSKGDTFSFRDTTYKILDVY